jgi:osmotically inducible lipoprotein OsmB
MNRLRVTLLGAFFALNLAACGSNPTREQIGTVGGAVVGGAAGHAVTGGSTIGTVGGAAAGAIIGKEVGENMDDKNRR